MNVWHQILVLHSWEASEEDSLYVVHCAMYILMTAVDPSQFELLVPVSLVIYSSHSCLHCLGSWVFDNPKRLDIEGSDGFGTSSIGGDGGGCGADIYGYW